MTVDGLLYLLAGLVCGRVQERAKGLDALRDLCGHRSNLACLLLCRRSWLGAWLRIGTLSGAREVQIMVELRWLIKRVKSDSRRPLREIGNEIHVVGGFRNTKRLQGPQLGDEVKRI